MATFRRKDSAERLTEIGETLAAGLVRLRARKSTQISIDLLKNALDFQAQMSSPRSRLSGSSDNGWLVSGSAPSINCTIVISMHGDPRRLGGCG